MRLLRDVVWFAVGGVIGVVFDATITQAMVAADAISRARGQRFLPVAKTLPKRLFKKGFFQAKGGCMWYTSAVVSAPLNARVLCAAGNPLIVPKGSR